MTDDSIKDAIELGKILNKHDGKDVVVIDLRGIAGWTDFFVIATARSSVHLAGLKRHVKEWSATASVSLSYKTHKADKDDAWSLIDLGSIIVHLMLESSREFYELENLWSEGSITRIEGC